MKKYIPILLITILIGIGISSFAQDTKEISFTHYGHACFLITTSTGTRILTDPMKLEGYNIPESTKVDFITVSHRHIDHDNVGAVAGNPKIFYGVNGPMNKGLEHKFIPIDEQVKDVRVYDIESNHFNPKKSSILNSIFIFEFDGIRVAHLGDFGYLLSEEQRVKIGAIDILMIPIGGNYTIRPSEADTIIVRLKPKMVVLPMHYKTVASPFLEYTAENFLKGKNNVKRVAGETFRLNLKNRPQEMQYVVMGSAGK